MKSIAVIDQRYGKEVNGGSEVYAREIAHRLSEFYDVDVLTTTALDYDLWKNHYDAGVSRDESVRVIRFKVNRERCRIRQHLLSMLFFHTPFRSYSLEKKWIEYQGPYCPDLIQYIDNHKEDYAAFVFVTYLYYPTAFGMPRVADKSVFIPTAHDEKPIWFRYYRELFTKPRAIGFLTEEEKQFVTSLVDIGDKDLSVIGSGVNVPERIKTSPEAFRKKFLISAPYIIYCGRVDAAKGADKLFLYFEKYKKETGSALELVVLGKLELPDPEKSYIHCLGFVSEQDKFDAMSGAKALVLPSRYESLSLVVLESMSLGVPVLVNGQCEVLKGHCLRSHAGLYYETETEFYDKLRIMDEETEEYYKMKENAPLYIEKYYSWSRTIGELRRMIENISRDKG